MVGMALAREPQKGLARIFDRYELMPELLVCARNKLKIVPPDSWRPILARQAHWNSQVEAVEGTPEEDVLSQVAKDAWRLFEWLELVYTDVVTETGHYISMGAGKYPYDSSWGHGIARELRKKIRKCYLGSGGLILADVAQEGAGILEQCEDAWINWCPGLLQVELEAILYSGSTDKSRAETLVRKLVANRRDAMVANPRLMSEIEEPDDVLRCSLAVTHYYRAELPQYTHPAVLTDTAVRSTARFLEAAWLLAAKTTDCGLVEFWESTPE